MNTIDAIMNRHSYRGKYRNEKIPREDLLLIGEAGLAAPSGCNKQTTSLIIVDDQEILKKLHQVIIPHIGESAPAMICVLQGGFMPIETGALLFRIMQQQLKICF